MSGAVGRILTQVGRRGAALLFFSLLDVMWAYALLNPPRPVTPIYVWPTEVMPLWAWATAWLTVAAVCLVFAFLRHDTPAFTVAVAIKVLWGGAIMLGWATGQIDRGYVTGTIWLAFAVFVFLIAGGIPAPPPRTEKARRWKRS